MPLYNVYTSPCSVRYSAVCLFQYLYYSRKSHIHDLSLKNIFFSGLEDVCNNTDEEEIIFDDFEELKAVVPEGIICQVDKDRPEIVKWKQTLNSPIVHAWRLERGQLIPINLFSNSHLPK